MEPYNEYNNYTNKGESDPKNNKTNNREPKDFITKGGITPHPLDKMFSNEKGYEIEIKEDNNDLYFDVVDEQTNKRYLSKINLPEGVTITDLFDSLEKNFYQIIKEENDIEIIMDFNKEGSPTQGNFILPETTPTPGQEMLKDEKSIFSNLYQDKYFRCLFYF